MRIIRLKRYRTMLPDGRSFAEYDAVKGKVLVAVIVGSEPLKITDPSQEINVEKIIRDAVCKADAAQVKRVKVDRKRKDSNPR